MIIAQVLLIALVIGIGGTVYNNVGEQVGTIVFTVTAIFGWYVFKRLEYGR